MKAISLLLATLISCFATSDAAIAGQCTTDVEQLQRKLSATDAGMGSTLATAAAQEIYPANSCVTNRTGKETECQSEISKTRQLSASHRKCRRALENFPRGISDRSAKAMRHYRR